MTAEEKMESISIMELKLVSEILECKPAVLPGKRLIRHRHLIEEGIAGLNYMPLDAKNDNVLCFSNLTTVGVCETYFGRMEMYLEDNTDEQVAIDHTLYGIRDAMQRNDFPSVDGILKVWYLEPELSDISGIAGGAGIITDNTPADDSFSTGTMIAFAALGVFVLAALILGAFRVRRRQTDGFSTLHGSTLTGSAMTAGNDSYGGKQSKSFSMMLPNSYKLDGADAMSAIPEGDSDSESRYNCSVIISDGGYTSDGDSHRMDDPLCAAHFDPVLGADNMDEHDMAIDDDLLFENHQNFSEHRKMNLVTGADVGLGERHSTVDVHQCTSARCTICNYKPKDVEFIPKSPNSPDVSAGKFFNDLEEDDKDDRQLS